MTLSDDQMVIVRDAVFHELNRLANLCVDASRDSFRLPSGRKLTQDEIRQVWARKDATLQLWNQIKEPTK